MCKILSVQISSHPRIHMRASFVCPDCCLCGLHARRVAREQCTFSPINFTYILSHAPTRKTSTHVQTVCSLPSHSLTHAQLSSTPTPCSHSRRACKTRCARACLASWAWWPATRTTQSWPTCWRASSPCYRPISPPTREIWRRISAPWVCPEFAKCSARNLSEAFFLPAALFPPFQPFLRQSVTSINSNALGMAVATCSGCTGLITSFGSLHATAQRSRVHLLIAP